MPELARYGRQCPLSSFKSLEKEDGYLEDQEVYRNPWDQPLDVLETDLELTRSRLQLSRPLAKA